MLKNVLIGLMLMASMVAPSIFAGVLIVAVVSAAVCNLDIFLERIGREMTETQKFPSFKLKLPSSLGIVGLVMAFVFVGLGFGWGMDPGSANRAVQLFGSCMVIAAHFCALIAFVVSMHKLVELVDLS